MDGPPAAAGGDVSLHNFSARLWEQLVHFHVMRLTDSLFLWVGATPHLRNLAVAMCNRYVSAGREGAEAGGRTGNAGRRGRLRIPSPCLPPSSETLLIRPPLALPSA
ncbi:proteasome assembly chaperone 4 isoform X2 [Panthera uncia]|uniref:proteasome assembly chaperone 4 isoform X2 n=1 Tax=Panthera uncia TaxID=29064 RepID=UPI0020FFEDD3|nr:proteasome assembly chaperone 4 isoform X2 [Panthera uncia]